MNLEVTKALVLIGTEEDTVLLTTTLPEACWPFEENVLLTMRAAKGTGEDYVKRHFPGIECEVIKL